MRVGKMLHLSAV